MTGQIETNVYERVRFSEVDSMGVVWHGSYLAYLEDAREALARKFGLSVREIFRQGYAVPIYDLHIRYMQEAHEGDLLRVHIVYVPSNGAKIVCEYDITRADDNVKILTASSIQLFTTMDGQLEPSEPDFFRRAKERVSHPFYSVTSMKHDGDNWTFGVSLDKECPVYRGHFPEKPVAPGVLVVDMFRGCAEQAVDWRLRIAKVHRVKFMHLVEPDRFVEAEVRLALTKLDRVTYSVKASLVKDDEEYANMTADLSAKLQ